MITTVQWINCQIMAEVLVATHMIACFLEHREHYGLRLTLTGGACLLMALLFPMPEEAPVIAWGLLTYTGIFVLDFAAAAVCCRETPAGILCCAITGYTIHQAGSALSEMLTNLDLWRNIGVPGKVYWAIGAAAAYILGFFWMSPGVRKYGHIRTDRRMLPILSAAVLLVDILVGLMVRVLSAAHSVPEYNALIMFMDLLACGFILMLQRELFSNRSLELQLQVVSQMLQEEKRQYEQSRSNITLINQKCHDLKHQIRVIRKSGSQVDPSVLKEIEKAVQIYDTSVQTGCAALDVILTEKMLLCESRGILLSCMADGSGLNAMSAPDIYALFGNILDNAIAAVGAAGEDVSRRISLSVRTSGDITVIHEENCYAGTLRFLDGLPETIQEDRAYHGFGVRSIKAIAETYNGSLSIQASDNVFSLTVMVSP